MKKILVCGDIHGRHEAVENAYRQFVDGNYDLLIFLGDYVDSYDRSNEDMLRTLNLLFDIKYLFPDKVVLLTGNHDITYLYFPDYYCTGFRDTLQPSLTYLYNENRTLFQSAFQLNSYLFTHAGVNKGWYNKYKSWLDEYRNLLGITKEDEHERFAEVLNAVAETKDRWFLYEVGTKRGGLPYSKGGIVWCDDSEMMQFNPMPGYHQIVGHSPQKDINTRTKFQGITRDDTSVTFCDVLNDHEEFLILKI